MDKYYYLIAQLPFLEFGKESYIKKQDFLQEAERWLSKRDFLILIQAEINNFSLQVKYPQVLKTYMAFERELREQIFSLRKAIKTGTEYKLSGSLREVISEAKTPLELERGLLRLRWEFIEEQEVGHFFDFSFLVIYYLKIQILERLFMFNKEKGKAKFREICKVKL